TSSRGHIHVLHVLGCHAVLLEQQASHHFAEGAHSARSADLLALEVLHLLDVGLCNEGDAQLRRVGTDGFDRRSLLDGGEKRIRAGANDVQAARYTSSQRVDTALELLEFDVQAHVIEEAHVTRQIGGHVHHVGWTHGTAIHQLHPV